MLAKIGLGRLSLTLLLLGLASVYGQHPRLGGWFFLTGAAVIVVGLTEEVLYNRKFPSENVEELFDDARNCRSQVKHTLGRL